MRQNYEFSEPSIALDLSPSTFSDLIGSIYDCALDPSQWEHTLTEITKVMSAESAILSINDFQRDRPLVEKSVGWGNDGIKERMKHTEEINGRLMEWFSQNPSLDQPFIARRQLSSEYLENSAYVQQCLKPLGIVDLMHLFLKYTPTHFSEIVVGRHQRHGFISDREIGVGMIILPHLRRAVTISNVLDARAIEQARMADVLDALKCSVVLTNSDGRIMHANRQAETMLQKGDIVRGTNGVLSVVISEAARELRKAIHLAARDETSLGKVGLGIRLTQPHASPIFAHILPLGGSNLRTRLQPEATVAIFIGPSTAAMLNMTPIQMKRYLRDRFGLTSAESDVALEILKGDGREAAGARLGITATTVRAHLSSIFDKTGVRRQAELIRLLIQGELETER